LTPGDHWEEGSYAKDTPEGRGTSLGSFLSPNEGIETYEKLRDNRASSRGGTRKEEGRRQEKGKGPRRDPILDL